MEFFAVVLIAVGGWLFFRSIGMTLLLAFLAGLVTPANREGERFANETFFKSLLGAALIATGAMLLQQQ